MLELFARIRRLAPHFRTTTLVTGAAGTGMELARALPSRGQICRKLTLIPHQKRRASRTPPPFNSIAPT
jgi:hypothetical protein